MKGFVPTPSHLVDAMVAKLFRERRPRADDRLLDPGCGTGAFVEGILRWCESHHCSVPRIVAVESDPSLMVEARQRLQGVPQVTLLADDFLSLVAERFDFIVGNPPYVSITGLTSEERGRYRKGYQTARGRFDLYVLFFEQALRLLKPGGRLVFVTPEKFLYVQSGQPLRRVLSQLHVEEIEFIAESTFADLVTYPVITTIRGQSPRGETRIVRRDGTTTLVRTAGVLASWLPLIHGKAGTEAGPTLVDAFSRISCGVATGADSVYVLRDPEVPEALRPFAYPTMSGRGLSMRHEIVTTDVMLVPYRRSGDLIPESELGSLGKYLGDPERRSVLLRRTCVARKPWYAFHETPPLLEILQPKLLCKDIGNRPWFFVDETGDIVPRHSVYYLVPKDPSALHHLRDYLNSQPALEWLMANCQRAANGFIRLQSHVLKRMPLPERLTAVPELAAS